MIDPQRLRELVSYDPDTGVFTRRADGAVLGHKRGGSGDATYVGIMVDGEQIYAHRAAWAYMTGEWPSHTVDHRDTDRQNNRWGNLRAATHQQQNANCKVRRHNQTGLKGVCIHKSTGLYGARIRKDGRQRSLGYYRCPAAAHFAYLIEADRLFGEFARGR